MAERQSKILTLPCGGTLSASLIRGVRVLPPFDSSNPEYRKPERVEILRQVDLVTTVVDIVYADDPHAFAKKASDMHRNPWFD